MHRFCTATAELLYWWLVRHRTLWSAPETSRMGHSPALKPLYLYNSLSAPDLLDVLTTALGSKILFRGPHEILFWNYWFGYLYCMCKVENPPCGRECELQFSNEVLVKSIFICCSCMRKLWCSQIAEFSNRWESFLCFGFIF